LKASWIPEFMPWPSNGLEACAASPASNTRPMRSWLDRATYTDVTDQYFDVHAVRVELAKPGGRRFAYLCVFNGGEWRPIHWGRVAGDSVTFDKMNGGLLYLPAYFEDGAVVPAAAPLFLHADGSVETFRGPAIDDTTARLPTTADVSYDLFVWDLGWTSRRRIRGVEGGVTTMLPGRGLLWLVADGSRKLERPFRVVDGALRFL
jgi:hypothetical protein